MLKKFTKTYMLSAVFLTGVVSLGVIPHFVAADTIPMAFDIGAGPDNGKGRWIGRASMSVRAGVGGEEYDINWCGKDVIYSAHPITKVRQGEIWFSDYDLLPDLNNILLREKVSRFSYIQVIINAELQGAAPLPGIQHVTASKKIDLPPRSVEERHTLASFLGELVPIMQSEDDSLPMYVWGHPVVMDVSQDQGFSNEKKSSNEQKR